jgi:hypothetical protein
VATQRMLANLKRKGWALLRQDLCGQILTVGFRGQLEVPQNTANEASHHETRELMGQLSLGARHLKPLGSRPIGHAFRLHLAHLVADAHVATLFAQTLKGTRIRILQSLHPCHPFWRRE